MVVQPVVVESQRTTSDSVPSGLGKVGSIAFSWARWIQSVHRPRQAGRPRRNESAMSVRSDHWLQIVVLRRRRLQVLAPTLSSSHAVRTASSLWRVPSSFMPLTLDLAALSWTRSATEQFLLGQPLFGTSLWRRRTLPVHLTHLGHGFLCPTLQL